MHATHTACTAFIHAVHAKLHHACALQQFVTERHVVHGGISKVCGPPQAESLNSVSQVHSTLQVAKGTPVRHPSTAALKAVLLPWFTARALRLTSPQHRSDRPLGRQGFRALSVLWLVPRRGQQRAALGQNIMAALPGELSYAWSERRRVEAACTSY